MWRGSERRTEKKISANVGSSWCSLPVLTHSIMQIKTQTVLFWYIFLDNKQLKTFFIELWDICTKMHLPHCMNQLLFVYSPNISTGTDTVPLYRCSKILLVALGTTQYISLFVCLFATPFQIQAIMYVILSPWTKPTNFIEMQVQGLPSGESLDNSCQP